MAELRESIAAGFDFRFKKISARVRELSASLNEEQFWTRPFPFGNSFGHLVLHLTGNLSYYIGSQIAQTGYVRTRDREFTDPVRQPKADVMRAFDETVKMVLATLAQPRPEGR